LKSEIFDIGLRLGASLTVGLVTVWSLEVLQLKYALAFTLSLAVFALMSLYTKYDKTFPLTLNRANISVRMWLLSWFLAILIVILIKPFETSSQFLLWTEIPALMWLRLIAIFSLTTIYPGYALMRIIVRGSVLRFLEKCILSTLLSILISSTVGFVGILISNLIGTTSLLILLSVNIFLLILTSYLARHDLFGKSRVNHVVSIRLRDITSALLLFALIAFILLSTYSVNFPNKLVPTIDPWYHYGSILRALNGTLFSFVSTFYWFYMYVGVLLYGTGGALVNAYMTLFVLCSLPILCFCLMCSRFWNKNRALVVTFIFALFSGFGGIYVDYLRLTSGQDINWIGGFVANKTFDISQGAVSFHFYIYPALIGFSAFFTLIWLIYDRTLPRLSRIVLISAIFTLGYLTHVAEMYIFLMVTAFLLVFSRKNIPDLKCVPYGLVSSLIVIATVDFLAPQKNYGFYHLLYGYFEPAVAGFLGMVALLCIIPYLRLNLFSSIGEFATKVAGRLCLPIAVTATYLLTLGVIVWLFLYPTFSIGYTGETFVWYLYPIRLGIALFMAVLGAYQLLRIREFKTLKLSLIIILVSVGLERVLSYFITENMMQFVLFSPVRMVEFTWVGIAMLATPILELLLKQIADKDLAKRLTNHSSIRKFSIAGLLIMIITSGSSSTLYNVQIRSTPSITLTNSELEALDFLRNEIPPNVTILALGYSVNKINDFGGRYPVMYYQPAIFGAETFEAFVDIMNYNPYNLYAHFPIKYFWLANSDLNELKKFEKGYFVSYLLNYLPVVYKNDEVTIFNIPSFSTPSEDSDLAVVTNPSANSNQEPVLEMLSLANLSYLTKLDFESFTSANITRILPTDPSLYAQNDLPYTIPKNSVFQEKIIVFNSLGVKAKPNFNDKGPTVYETFSKTFLRTSYQYLSPENIIFYLDLSGATKYNVTSYPTAWRFMNITSTEGLVEPSVTDVNAFVYLNATIPNRTYRVYWTVNGLYQPVGWREDYFLKGWSISTNKPESGNITVFSNGTIATITFNASTKNVWQYFTIGIPAIDVQQYPYLIFKEETNSSDYNLGYLRVVSGGYTYLIRDWTIENKPPSHPWKTYVFDLSKAIPERNEAPKLPEGPITQISWTGYSTGENGGTAKLHLDYIMLTSQTPILSANITIFNDFEDGNEDKTVYSGTFSKKLSVGESYSLLEDADYLGIALYGNGYINGEAFNYDYWEYHWVEGNKLNITSNGNCYIDKVANVRIDPAFENRALDGIENPFLSKFEEPFGAFTTFLAVDFSSVKQKQVVNGIIGPGGEVAFPFIEVPLFYSHDTDVIPIAFYMKDGEPVSPYAFSKKTGDHEIIYVQVHPYFDAFQQRAGTDEGREMFTKLGDLIRVLGLPLPKYRSPSEPMGRAILYGQALLTGNVTIRPDFFYIPALDARLSSAIGWKDDAFLEGWSVDTVGNGTANVNSNGDTLQVTFNATAKFNTNLRLQIPNVDVSQYRYLIFREKIESKSYMFGYLRLMIGGYVYCVRGWTSETMDPGHPWKTYVFDLYQAVPERTDAPTLPKGSTSKIWWYGGTEKGGFTKIYLDYVMLASSPLTPNYREIIASLDLSEVHSVFIDGVPTTERTFVNMKILDMQTIGNFNSTFTSTEVKLTPPGLGHYSKIVSNETLTLTLWLTNNSKVSFTALIGGKSKKITINDGKINLNLISPKEELVAYMSNAQVSAKSYTKFEKAFISWPYIIYNPTLPMVVNGSVTFKVNMMDQDFSLISKLKIEGDYKTLTQQVTWNEWNIPWLEVLSSPYHLLIVSTIAATLIIYEVRKKLRFKITLRLN